MTLAHQLHYAITLVKHLFGLKIIKLILLGLIIFTLAPVVFFIIVRPIPQEHINYGINFSNKYARELGLDWQKAFITILDDLKPKYVRLVAYWDETEPQKGNYNYSEIKWQLDEAQKRNVQVIFAMGRKVPRFPECFEPNWWKEIEDEKQQETALLDYVKNTTLEFKNYQNIFMWQVENEPYFPFGLCDYSIKSAVEKEVALVKTLDARPILVQDSGEGGFWRPTYEMADTLGISMYRRIWYDFWKIFFGRSIYFEYPLAHWSYKIKSVIVGVPLEKIIITELQAEPWGPGINSKLADSEKQKTMSKQQFLETINYAQKSGFKDIYFWGVEWWLWEKEQNNNPFYWDTGKAVIQD